MRRTVFCHYEQHETEGLDYAPYPGELGQQIYAEIGKNAWNLWLEHQTLLINEHRLSPRTAEHRAFLKDEMRKFLFEKAAARPTGYVAPVSDETLSDHDASEAAQDRVP